jgi:hypothetical protein
MKKLLFTFAIVALVLVSAPAHAATSNYQAQLETITNQLTLIRAGVAQVASMQGRLMSNLSGPLLLQPGQAGAWTISAAGDLSGRTRYAVVWGDEVAKTEEFLYVTANADTATQQLGEFRHAYRQPGDYHVMLTVTNSKGVISRTNLPVSVRDQSGVPVGSLTLTNLQATTLP